MIRKRTNDRSANRHQRSPLWRHCATLRSLKQIHATLIVKGFTSDPSAVRELIFAAAVVVPGAVGYALKVFDRIPEPDTFTWNTMIRGAAQSLKPRSAVSLYTRMENGASVRPDRFTFPFAIKACTKLGLAPLGFSIHGRVVKFGFESNTNVRNTLIYFHANCGELGIARELFEASGKAEVVAWSALTAGYARRGELGIARELFNEMPVKDLVSWNVMITGYAKRGQMEEARKLFDEAPQRDVVTWNAMIAGYVLGKSNDKAFEMFEEMRLVGEMPDDVTMLSLLSACAELGDLEIGTRMHQLLQQLGEGDLSTLVGNALIDMYAKCGSIERAFEVFCVMKERDVSTWNSAIGGLAFHGHAERSISLFKKMLRLKIPPDEITLVGVLIACSHAGKVKEGRQYFNLMSEEYDIKPNIRHYGCMVDLFGRAGLLKEAFEFVETMEIPPNAIIWRTLLGACRIHGNVELGELANERLLRMRHDESGDYVLLSNLYALKGDWNGAEKVRKSMDDSGIMKGTGYSLIEADDDRALMHYLFNMNSKG
ncbi:pentatricopeptide repeat-containing protein At5g15300 [Punica granatum]|uniref:Pentatricopeptide repeat-containing protein At5g15300 n=1 Tax=Punica granatum TaxID=22663 RepID=A0A6P8EKN0_PUNGR|nr:pentatricopeptide repeat-containing protein At5g15300 [Punica granatum]XP_031407294.1 pentatricopeptide repeat-containing protein At5g15300 [Punica granatum]XP_031407295.1 pentatricopeptide repeat-containing protein At5g15300 [Punica granatum]XP_031407297.1 pentatricopeptide repeat-containing protein At5g15300 [Punica granatum]XP_031407298.1 pentatricopeptide repeat-containing protein At5g15300 [Punica granatum]